MNELDEILTQTVTATWEAVLGVPIDVSESQIAAGSREEGLVGCIHVTGEDGGVVTLECSHALAQAAAAVMFHLDLPDVQPADAEDAFGELTNIIGGNFKATLSDGHQLSLPTVVEGKDFRTRFIGTSLASRVGFRYQNEFLLASFFREGIRADGASLAV